MAARLEMTALLSINFLPNAVYQPAACLQKTFEAAVQARFALHHLMFEVTENEPSRDIGHFQNIFTEYKRHGMITAIYDFRYGYFRDIFLQNRRLKSCTLFLLQLLKRYAVRTKSF